MPEEIELRKLSGDGETRNGKAHVRTHTLPFSLSGLSRTDLGSHSWSVMASRPGIARIDSQGAASRARFDMVSSRTAQHGAAKLAGSGRSTLYPRDYNSPPVPVMYTRRLAFYAQHRIPPLTLPLTSLYLIRKRLKQPERSGRYGNTRNFDFTHSFGKATRPHTRHVAAMGAYRPRPNPCQALKRLHPVPA